MKDFKFAKKENFKNGLEMIVNGLVKLFLKQKKTSKFR